MPNIRSVLNTFEKTISANEEAGVTSNMFLSQVAKRPVGKIAMQPSTRSSRSMAGRARPPVTRGGSMRSSRLGDLPEMKIPTDVTVTTTASSMSEIDDGFISWKVRADADESFSMDDGFELCSNNDEGSLQTSFTSFTSGNQVPQRRKPISRQGSNSSISMQPRQGSLTGLKEKLENTGDDGFRVVDTAEDSRSVRSSRSMFKNKSVVVETRNRRASVGASIPAEEPPRPLDSRSRRSSVGVDTSAADPSSSTREGVERSSRSCEGEAGNEDEPRRRRSSSKKASSSRASAGRDRNPSHQQEELGDGSRHSQKEPKKRSTSRSRRRLVDPNRPSAGGSGVPRNLSDRPREISSQRPDGPSKVVVRRVRKSEEDERRRSRRSAEPDFERSFHDSMSRSQGFDWDPEVDLED